MNFFEFFEKTDSRYIFIGLLFVFLIVNIIVERKKSEKESLQFRIGFYVVAMAIIYLTLPYTPKRLYYDVSDLENKKVLLELLQQQNEINLKMNRAFQNMFLITLIFFVPVMQKIIGHLKIEK